MNRLPLPSARPLDSHALRAEKRVIKVGTRRRRQRVAFDIAPVTVG